MLKKTVIILLGIQFITLALYIYASVILSYSRGLLQLSLFLVLVVIFLFFLTTYKFLKEKKQLFRISYLFLIGFLIVNFQRYFDVILNNVSVSNNFLFVNEKIVNRACLISLSGLSAFCLGYLIYNPKKIIYINKVYKVIRSIKKLKIILLIFVLYFLYLNLTDFLTVTYSQEYLESKAGTMAAYSELIVKSLIYSILILYNWENSAKVESVISYFKGLGLSFFISILLFLIPFIFLGDRGPMISVLSVLFFSYVIRTRIKLKLHKIIIIAIPAVLCLNIIGDMRKFGADFSMLEKVEMVLNSEKQTDDDSFFEPTKELAASVNCLHHAISYVPEKHPYLCGSLQLRSFFATIPFASKLLSPFLNPDIKYYSSAYFITFIDQGYDYKYGLGSSVVADLYLSFDIWGVFLGLLFFGMLIRLMDEYIVHGKLENMPAVYLTLAFSIVSGIIYMSRSTIFTPFTAFIPTYLIVLLSTLNIKFKIK